MPSRPPRTPGTPHWSPRPWGRRDPQVWGEQQRPRRKARVSPGLARSSGRAAELVLAERVPAASPVQSRSPSGKRSEPPRHLWEASEPPRHLWPHTGGRMVVFVFFKCFNFDFPSSTTRRRSHRSRRGRTHHGPQPVTPALVKLHLNSPGCGDGKQF